MYVDKIAVRKSHAGCNIMWYYDGQMDHIKTRQFVDTVKIDCACVGVDVSPKFPGTLGEAGRGFYVSDYVWFNTHPTYTREEVIARVNAVVTQMRPQRLDDLTHGRIAQTLTETEIKSGWHWCGEFDELLTHKAYGCCSCHLSPDNPQYL